MKELVFHRLLLPTAERHASAPAFIEADTDRTVTFGEHLDRSHGWLRRCARSSACSREIASGSSA